MGSKLSHIIDHSRSLQTAKKFIKRLMYGKYGIRGNKPFRQLPRAFIRTVKALDFENIKNAVGAYLQNKEVKAILSRKKLLLTEIEEMIKEKSENKVLY